MQVDADSGKLDSTRESTTGSTLVLLWSITPERGNDPSHTTPKPSEEAGAQAAQLS